MTEEISEPPTPVETPVFTPAPVPSNENVSLSLYRHGLLITHKPSDSVYFLQFSSLKFTEHHPSGESIASLDVIGVVGCVKLGPGYLVLITHQEEVFKHKSATIWNIKKALVIPLKYELAQDVFKVPKTGEAAASTTADSGDDSDNESIDTSSSSTSTPTIAKQLTIQKDMLFSKLGVYANDLKSTASLALSNQRANKLNFDQFDQESEQDLQKQDNSSSSSFKLNRTITIRGLPKKLKENNVLPFLEKAKVRKYSALELDCNISSEMLYKFERQLQNFYSTGDFYYSQELDLTRHIQFEDQEMTTHSNEEEPNSFCYNKFTIKDVPSTLRIPIIQGFVNSITFPLMNYETEKAGTILLLSKRSTHRAGSRYLRRGIDDSGNVANFVFTSQFLIVDDYMPGQTLFTKFDIMRGSIPIFFQQDPSKLKPVPYLTRPIEKCDEPFREHFDRLKKSYEDVACINLVERSKKEVVVGASYETLCKANGIKFDWFDFHEVCKKMKFDNVIQLLKEELENDTDHETVEKYLVRAGWEDSLCEKTQSGIFRVNCVDCLDRTNLVQKFLAEFILGKYILEKYCLEKPGDFQKMYNNLWADNGDYISRQYSSTNALKGDYTRTSKRNYAGLLTDAFLTMSRYYSGYISDYFKQCFIDYLLGHQNSDIFEHFEATLNVLDPNEINENLNKKNSVLQTIIGGLNFDDDVIIIGSWSEFMSPMQYNTLKLKNVGLKSVSLFVTNKDLFIVDFDVGKSEIREIITIDISDIKHLEYGTYILSTHNSISLNPKRNIGLKIFIDKGDKEQHQGPLSSATTKLSIDEERAAYDFITIKFPQDMEYNKVKYIIDLISKTCHSSTLEYRDIMTSTEASNNVIDALEYKFKKMVWG